MLQTFPMYSTVLMEYAYLENVAQLLLLCPLTCVYHAALHHPAKLVNRYDAIAIQVRLRHEHLELLSGCDIAW